jgi:hypothetical protein
MASDPQPSVTSLVSSAISDTQGLVKDQIELTAWEMKQSAKSAGSGSGLLIGAAFLAIQCFTFLLVAAAFGLAELGLQVWAGFLIVAVALGLVGGLLGMLGRARIKHIKGPERSKAALSATTAALSRPAR